MILCCDKQLFLRNVGAGVGVGVGVGAGVGVGVGIGVRVGTRVLVGTGPRGLTFGLSPCRLQLLVVLLDPLFAQFALAQKNTSEFFSDIFWTVWKL